LIIFNFLNIVALLYCGEPALNPLVLYKSDSEWYTYRRNITYFCQEGYVIQGFPFDTCQDNGKWKYGSPNCVNLKNIKECEVPVLNDLVTYRQEVLIHNEIILIYFCPEGFTLLGSSIDECKIETGKWKYGSPECVKFLDTKEC